MQGGKPKKPGFAEKSWFFVVSTLKKTQLGIMKKSFWKLDFLGGSNLGASLLGAILKITFQG